jgi:hypothetical protein
VIKRLEFAVRRAEMTAGDVVRAWRETFSADAGAPTEARPRRIVLCATLSHSTSAARHDAIALEWFTDDEHLRRFEQWRAMATGPVSDVVEPAGSAVIVAHELVLRGEEWLGRRWPYDRPRYKHMALARRAAGLTPAEFSARWRGHAGRATRAADDRAVEIPRDVLGVAYVQDHPLPREGVDWAYDAVNEVYFEDLDGLRRREQWFDDNLDSDGRGDDIFGQRWFLSAREEVLLDSD